MYNFRFIVIALIAIILESCKTNPPQATQDTVTEVIAEDPVLIRLGDKAYTTRHFVSSYEKNRHSLNAEKPLTPEEYVGLFTNMKLKVLAAQKEGGDTTQQFKDEMASYREILSQNFLNDKDLVEQFTKEAYERSKSEVHASHILIRVPELAAPEDTLRAYRKAASIWDQLKGGADFAEMAVTHSEDPSAKTNRGDLGSFTVFQMVYPFETAAYTTPVGQFSGPVRSVHGYHIVKVHSRRANRGRIQVAHCMIQSPPNDAPGHQQAAREKIGQAYASLQAGEEWGAVVAEYSEDKRSVPNQGILPPFGIGAMIKPFEEAAFQLKKVGDFTEPVQTDYGWHIIRLVHKFPVESYEDAAPAIRQKVTQDSRGRLIENLNHQKIRSKYLVTENKDVFDQVEALTDSTLLRARWTIPAPVPEEILKAHLFAISKKTFSGGEFLDFLRQKQKPVAPQSSVHLTLKRYYNDFMNEKLVEHAKSQLEKEQPDFLQLIEEISDGVLLSNMMEKHVWGKSLSDSLGQRQVFEQNKDKYRYPDRALATVVTTKNEEILQRARKLLAVSPYSLELKAEDLIFAENETKLSDEAIRQLRKVITAMSANPAYVVEVNGHRDEKESRGTSESRLNNIVDFLKDNNIPLTRIIEKNHDILRNTGNAAHNRRVSFLYYSTSARDVARVLNNNTEGEEVMIRDGYLAKDDPALSGVEWKTGEQVDATSRDKKWILIKKIEAARPKTFEEARGAVINDYQQILEQQWLTKLKVEYPATIDKAELSKVK